MRRAKTPVVRAGGDWAAALGRRMGKNTGDLSHHAVEQTRQRLRLALLGFTVVFTVLVGRLTYLTAIGETTGQSLAAKAAQTQERPIITDRHGVVLATQISTTTLGANPSMIEDGAAMARQLKAILPKLNEARAARLLSGKNHYVILQDSLKPDERRAVLNLGNPALQLKQASSRVYPNGQVTSHMVGYSSSDHRGLAGIELWLDQDQDLALVDNRFEASLDVRVQHSVRDELLEAMGKFEAKGAAAVIMDAHNGELIASVSLPDFDSNQPTSGDTKHRFNKILQGRYELGSVFKIFTAAMALDGGYVDRDELFETSETLQIGPSKINDDHPQNRPLNLDEIVIHSSNIGSSKVALLVSDENHAAFLQSLGMRDAVDATFPARAAPLPTHRWTDIERATASFGHGISVTPLHVLQASAAMVNGGVLYPPSLQKVAMPIGQRVISAQTSAAVRTMMRDVVTLGTGKKGEVEGYQVIGKTGTAEKPEKGGYNKDKLLTSFVSAFPGDAPQYVMLVMMDEPKGVKETSNFAGAGWNAAPTSAKIIRRVAPILGVLPRSDVIQKEAALQSLNTQTAMSEERVRPAQGSAQNQGASNAP
jgi:cell division protein FtsI (penicillin-binding protein 3)